MDGQGVDSNAIASITTLVTGLTKIIQAGIGDKIDKPAAMLISFILSIIGVGIWSVSTGQPWQTTWLMGQAQAVVIVCLASIGIFSAMQAVTDRVEAKKLEGTGDGTLPPTPTTPATVVVTPADPAEPPTSVIVRP